MRTRIILVAGLIGLTTAAVPGCANGGFGRRTAPPPIVVEEPSERHSQQLDDAHRAMQAGDYDIALAMFREILAENPTITPAYLGMGEIYLVQQDYEKAEPVYARAARLEPRNFEAQYGHGFALQMLQRFAEAVRAYHRALTIDPDNPKANLNLATTYLQLSEPRNAVLFAERAVEVDPSSGAARANLGAVYEQLDRNAEAVEQYLMAMELLEENTAPLMLNLINVLGKEKRYREAVNTAEHLVRVQPTANAYERLGWGYFRLGEFDRSINAYRKSVELDPQHWLSWSGIGVNSLNAWLLSERKDTDAMREARTAFRRSLQINPDQPRLITLMSNYGL
ncbi:MAG TPA: tetratricopeptide repeat protein [Phycisphaerales bacterium]|nr:tetratricopeptide repeat protein [Phycisphaerales bacterium]HRQ75349.1 tetratricopeptide repeat protein [Phycisphaerales bacterium]